MTAARRWFRYGGLGFALGALAQLPILFAVHSNIGMILQAALGAAGALSFVLSFYRSKKKRATE